MKTPKETSKEVIDELCKILDATPKKYRETMTPQEKAEELVDKYYNILPFDKYVITKDEDLSWEYNDWEEAKKCALIAVDEIIIRTRSVDTMPYNCQKIDENTKEYWKEVKQEIELL